MEEGSNIRYKLHSATSYTQLRRILTNLLLEIILQDLDTL